jgi:hypothetical protein
MRSTACSKPASSARCCWPSNPSSARFAVQPDLRNNPDMGWRRVVARVEGRWQPALAVAAALTISVIGLAAGVQHQDRSRTDFVITRARPTFGYFIPGCGVAATAQQVLGMFAAFNSGRIPSVMRWIAPAGQFRWFTQANGDQSAGGERDGSRSRLDIYLRARWLAGERWRLVMLTLRPEARRGRPSPTIGVSIQYRRLASDLPPNAGGRLGIADGKASIADCRNGRIEVWSSGLDIAPNRDYSEIVIFECPRPKDWRPPRPIIACAQ